MDITLTRSTCSTGSTSTTTELSNYWISDAVVKSVQDQDQNEFLNCCICIGTGRFLRSVLVPILVECGYDPIFIQPRGRTFIDYMLMRSSFSFSSSSMTYNSFTNNYTRPRAIRSTTTNPDNSTTPTSYLLTSNTSELVTTPTYEIDTVLPNGEIQTTEIPCYGVFSFNTETCKNDIYSLLVPKILSSKKPLSIIGIGVTEAGLVSANTQVMIDVYDLFCSIQQKYYTSDDNSSSKCTVYQQQIQQQKICVINTDNVPNNGTVIFQHMITLCQQKLCTRMEYFFHNHVVFINSMVDRITSHRDIRTIINPVSLFGREYINCNNNNMYNIIVPKCEPIPKKALVLLDTFPIPSLPYINDRNNNLGLVIRTNQEQFNNDIALKLRIANGTHTALAHVMALINLPMTDTLSLAIDHESPTTTTQATTTIDNDNDNDSIKIRKVQAKLLMEYIDCLINNQIIPAAVASQTTVTNCTIDDIQLVWDDWNQRLLHPYFGLSTFFITQNGPAKGGIRLGPTIIDLIQVTVTNNKNQQQNQSQSSSDDLSTSTTPTTTGISVVMSYAFAVLLRWLTPKCDSTNINGVYTGCLQNSSCTNKTVSATTTTTTAIGTGKESVDDGTVITYADGLRYNLIDGWYEFRCSLQVPVLDNDETTTAATEAALIPFSEVLQTLLQQQEQQQQEQKLVYQPKKYVPIIKKYLYSNDGGNMNTIASMYPEIFNTFAMSIAILYSRMIVDSNDHLVDTILYEMSSFNEKSSIYSKDRMNTDCSVLVEHFNNETCTIDTVNK